MIQMTEGFHSRGFSGNRQRVSQFQKMKLDADAPGACRFHEKSIPGGQHLPFGSERLSLTQMTRGICA